VFATLRIARTDYTHTTTPSCWRRGSNGVLNGVAWLRLCSQDHECCNQRQRSEPPDRVGECNRDLTSVDLCCVGSYHAWLVSNRQNHMKILVHRLCSLALLSLLSFLTFAAPAVSQNQIADPLGRPPDLQEKSRAYKRKTRPAASATAASGYNYQVLYSFGATTTDAKAPETDLIPDTAGNLYGTTFGGGAEYGSIGGAGTIFRLDTIGEESVLYSFCSATNCTDGMNPRPNLVQDAAGNLYGTTTSGGAGSGVVFKLAPPVQSDENWTQTVLYSFGGNNTDGRVPLAGLIEDAAGNLYGTTSAGGANNYGIVFMLAPPSQSGGTWTETVLYSFGASNADGIVPYAGLVRDTAGNLYGTTAGGSSGGTAFKLAPPSQSGGSWTETVLYNFCSATNCADGYSPFAGLIQDAAGNLYGTTPYGGVNTGADPYGSGGGTIFKLAPPSQSSGSWTETVLYNFCSATNCADGSSPAAGLIQDAAGNLYSTTVFGGANPNTSAEGGYGGGTVFKLTPPASSGGNWTESVLYNFCAATSCTDGSTPYDALIQDAAGNLYGTAYVGGTYGDGTAFKLILIQTPTLTVTPSPSRITSSQALSVGVTVGGVNGDPSPTGTVTLTSGSYASAATTLTGGAATINVPAGSLAVGMDTLTVAYSGDSYYQSGTGTATVTVTPGFTIRGAAVTIAPGATTGNTSTITVTPSGGFTGNVAITAVITSKPSGAQDLPTLSFGATSPVAITGASAGTATLTVTTTAATSAALLHPARPRRRETNSGGAALAIALLIGMGICVPARGRRSWTLLATLVIVAALAGVLVACGGSGTNTGNPGTTPGTYMVTVTGNSSNTTATSTVTLTVQ
jgi:uncharacterized repeat protein (TIGR03803 family)